MFPVFSAIHNLRGTRSSESTEIKPFIKPHFNKPLLNLFKAKLEGGFKSRTECGGEDIRRHSKHPCKAGAWHSSLCEEAASKPWLQTSYRPTGKTNNNMSAERFVPWHSTQTITCNWCFGSTKLQRQPTTPLLTAPLLSFR